MRTLVTITAFFLSMSSLAQSGLGSSNDAIELNCSDPVVRLSPVKIHCKPDGKKPIDFDIPELKIDLNDLEKIFQGAESSGGHTIGPMNFPRHRGGTLPRPSLFNCKAELLSDGGKTLSFISEQSFQLDQFRTYKMLYKDNWEHFLVEGNDFNSGPRVAVNQAPKVDLSNYKVFIEYNKRNKKYSLLACESNFSDETGVKSSSCSLEEFSSYRKNIKTFMRTIADDRTNNLIIKKTLKVSCKRLH